MFVPGKVRYAHTEDGIDIAYMTIGDGDRDLVLVHGFTTHLDLIWDVTWFSYWARRLTEAGFRVIQFDKRGTGLSDRSLGHGSIEDRARDILAVMDAAHSTRASIVGISEGGPMALVVAATCPERVDRLVVYGTMARVLWAPDYPEGATPEAAEGFISWLRRRWGTGEPTGTVFLRHAPSGGHAMEAAARFERNACTPHMAEEILRRNVEIDIRPLLAGVSVPTLVMHTRDDPIMLAAWGRYLAEHLPHAEYVEGEGDFHGTWSIEEFEPLMRRALEFLVGAPPATDRPPAALTHQRVVATVLFTDIVGSTELASGMGDAGWKEVLDRHDAVAAEEVGRFGGRLVKTTGDGLLATFDGPSRGIGCARAILEAVAALGMEGRAGLHTGEIERRGGDVGGIAVHLAARVADLACPGEVLATRTVRDLTIGSGLEFEERGRHSLKGVPDEWELFVVGG